MFCSTDRQIKMARVLQKQVHGSDQLPLSKILDRSFASPLWPQLLYTGVSAWNSFGTGALTHTDINTHSDIGFQLTQLPRWEGR